MTNNEKNEGGVFQKIIKQKAKESKTLELLTKFPYNLITNKELMFICDCCALYQAVYQELENVFIFEFNFFEASIIDNNDNDSKFEEILNSPKSDNKYTLELLGVYYNKDENIFSLIYKNSTKKLSLFVENSCISYKADQNVNKLIKLQLFYNIFQIIKQEHVNNRAINLLHPYFLFISKATGEIFILDSTFCKFTFCFNKYVNFPICSYFGIFDMDQLEKFDSDESYYKKSDIFLICALLVYFFRIKSTKASMNFDITLSELTKCFFLHDEKFQKLTGSIKFEKELTDLITSTLNLNYEKIESLDTLFDKYKKYFKETITKINYKCSVCQTDLTSDKIFLNEGKQINIICSTCGVITCEECRKQTPHACNDEKEQELLQQYQEKLNYTKYTENFEMLREIKGKDIINTFSVSIDEIFKNFIEKNDIAKRTITKEENFINDISSYIKKLLFKFSEEKYASIQKLINEIKSEDNNNAHTMKNSSNRISPKYTSTKKLFNPVDDKEENLLKEKMKKLSEEIENFKSFTSESSEMLSFLFYDFSIGEIFDLLHAKLSDFSKKVNVEFISYYKNSIDTLLKETIDIYSNAIPLNKKDPINEYTTEDNSLRNKNLFTFVHNSFGIYEILKYNVEKDPELSSPVRVTLKVSGNRQCSFKPGCRTLHLKTRCIVTVDDNAYAIYYENDSDMHEVDILPTMLYEHLYHMMIVYNTFDIIVMGGDATSNVEGYNFANEKWENMPSLNHARGYGCAFLQNERYLYVFGGIEDGQMCTDIEKFDLISHKLDKEWERIELTGIGDNYLDCIKAGSTKRKNDNEILIYGGMDNKGNFYEVCHVLNFDSMKVGVSINDKCQTITHLESVILEIGDGKVFDK